MPADHTHTINTAFANYAGRVAFSVTLTRTQVQALTRFARLGDGLLAYLETNSLTNKGLVEMTPRGLRVTRAGKAMLVLLEEAGMIPKLLDDPNVDEIDNANVIAAGIAA